MTNDNQRKIIQEQTQANERIVQAVEQGDQAGRVEGQAPVNERIKQMVPNERVQAPPQQSSQPKKDNK